MRSAVVFIVALLCFCFAALAFAQDAEQTPEPFTRADNECFAGGTMEGKCDQGFHADGTVTDGDIAWAWTCGWYMARYNDGTLSRDQVNTDCSILLPSLEEEVARLVEECATFFEAYTECLAGNYLRQDAGSDGSFESAWYIIAGVVDGDDGLCPAGTTYSGSQIRDYASFEPAFYAWLTGKGFGDFDDFCRI